MRKITLIELVLDHLAGGDAPDDVRGKYHPEVIANLLALAYNDVVMSAYMEGKMHSDYSVLDAWALNHTINITNNMVPLPYPPVQLPNGMGILQVACGNDLTNVFAYRETNSNAVFNALDVGSVSTKPNFYLEQNAGSGNHSHLLQVALVPDGVTSVLVKMIVPFDAVDDFATISIPAGKEKQLIDGVIALMREKPPEDTVNDNKARQQ
ncbi:MAG: hypothetical protein DRI97_01230 [Bacteroidetes bacterium]|nr:MAG: hypothetical protein DRI97_01230 [Bacteroidota bacterium]